MNLLSCSSCGRQFDELSRGWEFSHCSQHVGVAPIPTNGDWQDRLSGPTRRENFGDLSDPDSAF